MWKRKFHLVTDVESQTVVELISKLLTKRSVKHSIVNNHISSTHIPIFFLRFWHQYSRDNFVGVNPFIYIDNIKINVESNQEKKTKLEITVTQIRSYVPLIIFILIIIRQPWRTENDIFLNSILPTAIFATFAVLYYLFAFRLVIGRLITSEIKQVLKSERLEAKKSVNCL